MKTHRGKLICVDQFLTSTSVQDKLHSGNRHLIKDGIRVINVLRGRTMAGKTNDSDIKKAVKQGWMIEIKKLNSILTQSKVTQLEKIGDLHKGLIIRQP